MDAVAERKLAGLDVRRLLKELDLAAWDNWFPLAVIAVFVALGAFVAVAGVTFGVPKGDLERYHIIYTEIGVQTTAGIFAIIISLSLVAIQFAAQEYSHRIMDYYIKSVIFWSTFVVYLGVMILAMMVQAAATESENLRMVAVVIVGSVLALMLLIPHFLITASYLKPEFIIRKLLRKVDLDYLRSVDRLATVQGQRVTMASDRLLPVVEITQRSIDRGDVTTTRSALERILETYNLEAESLDSEAVDRYFLDHLLRIGRKAVAQPDEEEASVETIDILGRIGRDGPSALAAERIEVLGLSALKRDSEVVVTQMIDSLRLIFDEGPEDTRAAILETFKEMVSRLAAGQQERVMRHLARNIKEVTFDARGRGDAPTETHCLEILESIGHDAAVRGMTAVVLPVGKALENLGTSVAANDPQAAEAIILRLLRIERAVSNSEREVIAALEFSKGEIESSLPSAAPSSPPAETEPGENAVGSDFSNLWDDADEQPG